MNPLTSILAGILLATAWLGMAFPAHATLTFQPGRVGGSGDVSKVIFDVCGLGFGRGLTVQDCLGTNHA